MINHRIKYLGDFFQRNINVDYFCVVFFFVYFLIYIIVTIECLLKIQYLLGNSNVYPSLYNSSQSEGLGRGILRFGKYYFPRKGHFIKISSTHKSHKPIRPIYEKQNGDNKSSVVKQLQFFTYIYTNNKEPNATNNKSLHSLVTPFPQSINYMEWEVITHPSVQMLQATKDIAMLSSEYTTENSNNHVPNANFKAEKQGLLKKRKKRKISDESILYDYYEKEKNKNTDFGSEHKISDVIEVPKFWNPPYFLNGIRDYLGNYGERLITPLEASTIGSRIHYHNEDEKYNWSNNDENEKNDEIQLLYPLKDNTTNLIRNSSNDIRIFEEKYLNPVTKGNDSRLYTLETIYISVASYRDYRCPNTINSIFSRSTFPERVRVGIVDQIIPDVDLPCSEPLVSCWKAPNQIRCKFSHLIDEYKMDARLAVGPVFARHIGHRMYRGEYFAMQIDAHMEFVNGWDVDLIAQWRTARNEMAVLSTYVSDVLDHFDKESGLSIARTRPLMCDSIFEEDYYLQNLEIMRHDQQPEYVPNDVMGEPTLQPFWAAGFSFARGHFVIQVPYDQYLPMIFQGEEISVGIRGFTYGYDYYAPERSVVFHYYNDHIDEKKKKNIPTFWENSDLYGSLESASKARLEAIIKMSHTDIKWNDIEEKEYGIGKVRTVKKFLDTFGIYLEEKEVEKKLCNFVGAPMQAIFTPHLRENGMGIDYNKISYQYKESHIDSGIWESYYE